MPTIGMELIAINKEYKPRKYKWVCYSDDTAFEDESTHTFDSVSECYSDMRNAVLEKMKWNTEYDDGDFAECEDDYYDGITYQVHFAKKMIVHNSYSGGYVYKIIYADEKLTWQEMFTKEVVDFMKARELTEFTTAYFKERGAYKD